MGVLADCQKVVKEALAGLGGLDIIVSNAVRRYEPNARMCFLHEIEENCSAHCRDHRDGPSSATSATSMRSQKMTGTR